VNCSNSCFDHRAQNLAEPLRRVFLFWNIEQYSQTKRVFAISIVRLARAVYLKLMQIKRHTGNETDVRMNVHA
jgi:hypothetical protein